MDGKAHKISNVAAMVAMTGSALAFSTFPVAGAVLVGSYIGTVVTPDYDLDNKLPRSLLTEIPIIRTLWRWFWLWYMKLVPHRSWVSHLPIISTFIRFLYMFLGISFLLLFVDWGFGGIFVTINQYMTPDLFVLALIAFLAWCIQDLIHYILDFIL